MGATRRRRSSRQSSSQDSPSDCFGVCGAGSGRRRRDADQAQANRPVELQGLPGPTPYYTPGGRHHPTSRRQSTPHEVGGDRLTRSRHRHHSPHRSSQQAAVPAHPRESGSRESGGHQHCPRHSGSGSRLPPSHQPSPRHSGSGSRRPSGHQSSPAHSGPGTPGSRSYRPSPARSGRSTPLRASPRESQYTHSSRAPSRHSSRDHPLAPGLGDRLPSDNASYSYGEIQKVGARWQRWLEDENFSGCKVNLRRRPLDLMTLINHPTPSRRWLATRNYFCDPPAIYIQDLSSLGLPTRSDQYRKSEIQGPPVPEDDEPNEYTHCTGPGVIFAQDIARYDGPHWNDIALGQYAMDFSIDSLRHIYFCDVINQNTREFVVGVLYRNILPVPWRDWSPDEDVQRFWEYGTPEYQGILGTTFGKGVCALLISAFPRGDFMIGRVVTWKDGDLQMRFDIESTEHLNPRRGGGLF